MCYPIFMNVSLQGMGAVYLVALFLLCVILVHLCKLATIGYRTTKRKLPAEPPKTEENTKEPVYYIVEKKKKRVKTEYSNPKEIRFS